MAKPAIETQSPLVNNTPANHYINDLTLSVTKAVRDLLWGELNRYEVENTVRKKLVEAYERGWQDATGSRP